MTTFGLFLLINIMILAQDNIALVDPGAQPALTQLTVHLEGLKSDEGQLMVALYDSSDTWLSKNIMGTTSDIVDGKATVVFNNVPHGTYAVSSFHDKDSDGKLKTGLFGIPSEPYASSRGAKGMFGPPKWDDALFVLDGPTAEEVVKY